jgi:hypothetical protein
MAKRIPTLHRSQKAPMTPGRRWLLIIGAILLLAALGWALTVILSPALQRTIVITTGADKGIATSRATIPRCWKWMQSRPIKASKMAGWMLLFCKRELTHTAGS